MPNLGQWTSFDEAAHRQAAFTDVHDCNRHLDLLAPSFAVILARGRGEPRPNGGPADACSVAGMPLGEPSATRQSL